MAFTVSDILTMAQRFLVDLDDDAYRDTTTHQPMLDFYNEGARRFAAETHCVQAVVDVSVTTQKISYAAIVSAIGATAEQILYISKVIPKVGTNQVPLPKAPVSEMRALLASTITTPTRYSLFAEAVRFDTHPDTVLSFDVTVYCSYVPVDLVVTASILIPDEWAQAIVKYIEFCCRVTDRDGGLANGAYDQFDVIKQAAANLFISQIEKIPGVA